MTRQQRPGFDRVDIQILLGTICVVSFLLVGVHPARALEVVNCDWIKPSSQTQRPPGTWSLSTLPVGHGDAHLIEAPGGQVSLVDTASTETVDTVVQYLKRREIDNIDRIILTHPHWDHIGGVPTLVRQFDVGAVYRPGLDHPTHLNRRTDDVLRKYAVPVHIRQRGETIPLSPTSTATVLHPGPQRTGSLNPDSLAFSFSAGPVRIAMMGDVIGKSVETLRSHNRLTSVDVVKIAHHGNESGTPGVLLDELDPRVAIITAPLRTNDPWGKPDPELIQRLRNHGITIFHTGKTGTIRLTMNKEGLNSVAIGSLEACGK